MIDYYVGYTIFIYNFSSHYKQINNFMMYSSSPNLIKHFIPINFSKTTLDYQRSPIKMVQPI